MCLVCAVYVFLFQDFLHIAINCLWKIRVDLRRNYKSAVFLKGMFYNSGPEKGLW